MRRATTTLLAIVATVLVAAGCSATTSEPAAPAGQDNGSIASKQQTTQGIVPGYSVSIDRLGITNASLIGLGTNADNTIQTPPLAHPEQLGVYTKGPMPGANGPSIILGHINASGTPGVFAHLPDMKAGDQVSTTAPDGTVTRFVVYKSITMPKNGFETAAVYSDTPGPELRLISCTGPLDSTQHEYQDNVVVFARKA